MHRVLTEELELAGADLDEALRASHPDRRWGEIAGTPLLLLPLAGGRPEVAARGRCRYISRRRARARAYHGVAVGKGIEGVGEVKATDGRGRHSASNNNCPTLSVVW